MSCTGLPYRSSYIVINLNKPLIIQNWSRSFRWRERIAERDAQVARAVANRSITDEVDHLGRNLQIVHMALVQLAKAVADGQVKMNLGDLDRLIRLESFLRDEPDSRQEIVFGDLRNKSREELREMVRQEMEVLKELEIGEGEIQGQATEMPRGQQNYSIIHVRGDEIKMTKEF